MKSHIVVLGGGFGGLATAQSLAGADVQVTLIDRRNHHLFQPLLYQVATAALAPSDIAEPIRSILSGQDNVTVRLAEVKRIDADGKRVRITPVQGDEGTDEWLDYDYLVVALGVQQSWFGNDWAGVAPGLKTLKDALEIRRRILMAFERAEWADDPAEQARLLTFVVVGAGPTGVELAGAIAEIALTTFRKDFKRVDTARARVVLVEGSDAVLGTYPDGLRARAKEQLEELGVEVRLGERVTAVDRTGVELGEVRIDAETVLWAAGIQAPAILEGLGERDRIGRIKVSPDGSLPGRPEIFAIGDLAHVAGENGPLPGVAPVALGMGKHAGQCIVNDLAGRAREPFRYVDKGQMATIGRRRAVLESGWFKSSGTLAWLAWVFVHLMVLVTYRNRLLVFIKWAWAWLTYERASRLIWQTEGSAD